MAQVAVAARDGGPRGHQLAAYIVPVAGAVPLATDLRRHVAALLPEPMVPSSFVVLEALPLTPSGKLDRKALPAPALGRADEKAYRSPRTPKEEILSNLFVEFLTLQQASIDDHFFELGGDSILSIQLVSRARSAGLELTPRDVFQQPTVEALAAVARLPEDAPAPSGTAAATGAVIATPIMRSLLERGGPIGRYCQSMLLRVPANLTERDLTVALQALLDGHDALRLQLTPDGDLQIPPRAPAAAADHLVCVDLSGLDEAARRERMHAAAREAESRLDPHAGRMLQAVWFSGAAAGRLLLVIHHLAVDWVSWRILVSDLAAAWAAAVRGQKPVLEPVGTPFRAWAQHLAEQAETPAVLAELTAWEAILAGAAPLIPGAVLDPERDTIASAQQLRLDLSPSLTAALLKAVPAAFHARINDVLLATLAVALSAWRRGRGSPGDGPIVIDLEGHGREPMTEGIDLARTVGWFTSVFPVRLDLGSIDLGDALAGGAAMGRALKRAKEQLRAIPGRGLGFGLLRYLHPEVGPRLARQPRPQLGFNYLGRFAARRGRRLCTGRRTAGLGPRSRSGDAAGLPRRGYRPDRRRTGRFLLEGDMEVGGSATR